MDDAALFQQVGDSLQFVVSDREAGLTVRALARGVLRVSRTAFSAMKFSSGVRVNGVAVHARHVLRAGDVLLLTPPVRAAQPPQPGDAPLSVAYEDAWLLCVSKPAPLPAVASRQGGLTLENRVYSYLKPAGPFVYRPINRLDKGTSGLMLIAKDGHTQDLMQRLLHTERFARQYLAVVAGSPPDAGRAVLPIAKIGPVKRGVVAGGKPSVTRFETVARRGELALMRLQLETGRTHQIRVHLSHLGFPIVGDYLYGTEDARLPGRFALHACALRFAHPYTGQEIALDDPLPEDVQKVFASGAK